MDNSLQILQDKQKQEQQQTVDDLLAQMNAPQPAPDYSSLLGRPQQVDPNVILGNPPPEAVARYYASQGQTQGNQPAPAPTPDLPQRIGQIPQVIQQKVQQAGGGVMNLIQKYFPQSEWGRAYQVMMAESKGNPQAVGDNYPINGEVRPSFGLFQIRTFPNRPPPQALVDPETNVRYAAELWKSQGWKPWTTAVRMGFAG